MSIGRTEPAGRLNPNATNGDIRGTNVAKLPTFVLNHLILNSNRPALSMRRTPPLAIALRVDRCPETA